MVLIANQFVLILDANKAFGRVSYVKLLKLLLTHLPFCFTMLPIYILDSKYECYMGVEHGGVLTPVLFAVYIDALFWLCRRCFTSLINCL